jgi:RNA polymerase sigma factor (sigma-70 family)
MKGDDISNDQRILAGIFSNDLNAIIHQLYKQYSGMVIAYIITNQGSQQDGEDVFQEALIAFVNLVKSGKFRGEASLQTTFVSIARNIWLNEQKKRKSLDTRGKLYENARQQEADPSSLLLQREVSQQFLDLMSRLGESCRELLTLVYYENLSFKDILEKLHYENEQVIRNKKYKCMKELTDMIKDNPGLMAILKSMN